MFLDINEGVLLLDPRGEELKIRHTTQLQFWGFEKHEGVYRANQPLDILLPQVISYLEKSNLPVVLSRQSKAFLSAQDEKRSKFARLNTYLRKYKQGKIDDPKIKEHVESLKSLNRSLKDHQIKASYHLYAAKNGANFSVPGSGKTTVVLSVYQRLKNEDKVDVLFVIGPPSCFGAWREEFKAVIGREPDVKVFAGGNVIVRKEEYYKNSHSELNLSTFQTVARDSQDIPKLFSSVRVLLVVDEAHYIKQIGGEWASAVLSIASYAEYRVALTGTPMPKSYTDFFNLFEFLFPDTQVLDKAQKYSLQKYEASSETEKANDLLEQAVGPLFYRVRKEELNLADQVFCDPIKIQMNSYEWKVYDAIWTRIINYSQSDYLKNIDYVRQLIAGRMMRLRQCVSYTKLLSNTIEDYDEDLLDEDKNLKKIIFNYDNYEKPAKLIKLIEMAKAFMRDGEKILIWSNFIGTIKLIEGELKVNKLSCKKIIGETPTENTTLEEEETREDIRKEFIDENSGLRILIANPAACAEAISLHKSCNKAIYYDLSFNCAQYLQSLDRIHRVGGSESRPSYYYFLQYEDSIDSSILTNLNRKAQKMKALIDKEYEIYSLDMFEVSNETEDAYRKLIKQ